LDDRLCNRGQQQVGDSQPLQEWFGVDDHHVKLTAGSWCGDRLDANFCFNDSDEYNNYTKYRCLL
jgi:hypothetical protein